MKNLILAVLILGSGTLVQASVMTDRMGIRCQLRAEQTARSYFRFIDFRHFAETRSVTPQDEVIITKYESTTPGSLDQLYKVEALVRYSRKGRPFAPNYAHRVAFEMSGDPSCNYLKVLKFRILGKVVESDQDGGVERVD